MMQGMLLERASSSLERRRFHDFKGFCFAPFRFVILPVGIGWLEYGIDPLVWAITCAQNFFD